MNLALDLGYGWVKALYGPTLVTFPHAIGSPDAIRFGKSAGPLTVSYGEELRAFYVGELALKQSRHTWAPITRKRDAWELRAMLAEALARLGISGEIPLLISGLPVGWYAEDRGEHEQALQGEICYARGSRPQQTVTIEKVVAIPQPMGTFYHLAQKDESLLQGCTGIIDLGHHTTDGGATEDGVYISPESFSLSIGIHSLHEDLRAAVRENWKRELTPQEADKALRTGKVWIGPKSYLPPIQFAAQSLASEILGEVKSQWGEGLGFRRIVVTGGGAHILGAAVEKTWGHVQLVEEPELANVRGYQVYGEELDAEV